MRDLLASPEGDERRGKITSVPLFYPERVPSEPMAERIPRIPPPVVNQLPRPENRLPPPVVQQLQQPVINVPSAEIPSYDPPQFNPTPAIQLPPTPSRPSNQDVVDQVNEDTRELQEEAEPEVELPALPPPRTEIQVPIVGVVPLPYGREVALAGTTAIAATIATLLGKSFAEWLVKKFKPIVKKIILKIKAARDKRFTDYELQLYFELEGKVPEQKSVAKRLKAQKKAEKQKQLEAHLQRRHQHK